MGEPIMIQCDRHFDGFLAEHCLGHCWYMSPAGKPHLRDPEMIGGAWQALEKADHLVIDWQQQLNTPHFTAAPNLAYSLLLRVMREKGLYCTMGEPWKLAAALFKQPDEEDRQWTEDYVQPDLDAYDALLEELKRFAGYMVHPPSPPPVIKLRDRILALPSAAEKLARGDIYKMYD